METEKKLPGLLKEVKKEVEELNRLIDKLNSLYNKDKQAFPDKDGNITKEESDNLSPLEIENLFVDKQRIKHLNYMKSQITK